MTTRILHIFYGTDMRRRHEGLRDRARKDKVKLEKCQPGDVLAFLNAKRDRLMVLAVIDETDSYGVLGYYRSPHGRVPLEAIEFIPRAFGANGGFSMDRAIRLGLEKQLAKKRRQRAQE